MGNNRGNDSSANNFIWVLVLEAPRVTERKPEGTHRDFLTIDQGQDIREEVLNYFRNSTNNSVNYNGRKRMGSILSATGSVLHPNSNEDELFESNLLIEVVQNVSLKNLRLTDSYKIKYLSGRFIIYEDGRVDQYKSWTISCVGLSCIVITDEVNGPLISAEPVQVTVVLNPSR